MTELCLAALAHLLHFKLKFPGSEIFVSAELEKCWNRLNFYTLINKSRNRFKSGSPTNMHHMEPIQLEKGKRKSQQKIHYLFLASFLRFV